LIVGVAVGAALLSNRISARLRIPAPAVFLVGAAAASDLFPALSGVGLDVVEQVVTVALIMILFDGGMGIGLRRFRAAVTPILVVGVLGTLLTAAAMALLAHLLLGLAWPLALLLGTALAPTDPQAIAGVVDILQNLNRHDRAIEFDQYLVAHDPLSPSSHGRLAYDLARSARLDEAIAAYRTALRLAPQRIGTHYNIGEILLRQGKAEAALDEMRQEPAENYRLPGIAMAQFALGDRAASDATLADFVARFAADEPLGIASAYAFRHENDLALEWLDKGARQNDVGLVELPNEPTFAGLHDDPRWLLLLRRLGMAPDQLAAIRFEPSLPKAVP